MLGLREVTDFTVLISKPSFGFTHKAMIVNAIFIR